MNCDDFQRLYELQMVDTGIDERRTLLAEADDGTAVLEKLETAQEELEELEEQLEAKRWEQRKLELDMEGVEEEKEEKEGRAYGGQVSDPSEIAALHQKIEELDRNVDRHEDMILEVLDEIDVIEEHVEEQSEKVSQLQDRHESIVDQYETTTVTATEEIEQLQQRREELVEELPPTLLRPYESLRERMSGVAVAVLRDGTCSVCNVAVPRAQQTMVTGCQSIVKCESCRRILVALEE